MDTECSFAAYAWFEKCGIISHIRTHLRQNLINILQKKDSVLLNGPNRQKFATQYVYDLLIAEYLYNLNYNYTLSVFASEAPLLVDFQNIIPGCTNDEDESNRHRLKTDYVSHTLETIGISISEPKGQFILSEYSTSTLPLLLCILKSLFYNENKNDALNTNKCLSEKHVQTSPVKLDDYESKLILRAGNRLHRQKDTFDAHLHEKEMQLKRQIVNMEQQLASLNHQLKQMQHVMCVITAKEQQLKEKKHNDVQCIVQKEMELNFKENLLLQEANRLQKEQECYKKFETNLTKLQELVKVKNETEMKPVSITVKNIEVQTDSVSLIAKNNEMRIIIKEKQELSNLVQEQQTRIEQLTLRAVQLSRQLEELHLLKSNNIEFPLSKTPAIKTSTIISDSSSTEDILLDAKLRLKRLEEENVTANNYYLNCLATSL